MKLLRKKNILILGRGQQCTTSLADATVSRCHCLIEINPPTVTVRDFGSLNGTYLNGEMIGKRNENMSMEEARKLKYREFPLKNGDRLGLGPECEMIPSIYIPDYCATCSCELPESPSGKFEETPGLFLCPKCHELQKKKKQPLLRKKTAAFSAVVCWMIRWPKEM